MLVAFFAPFFELWGDFERFFRCFQGISPFFEQKTANFPDWEHHLQHYGNRIIGASVNLIELLKSQGKVGYGFFLI